MKTRLSLFLLLFPFILSAQWTNLDAGTNVNWHAIHFFDAKHGLVSGEFMGIAVTHDGGETWTDTLLDPDGAGEILYDCWMASPTTAYAAGSGGKVYRTVDGGVSWELTLSVTINNVFGIQFLDSLQGYFCGVGGTLFQTTDGGNSWSNIPLSFSGTLRALHFSEPGFGQVMGVDGRWIRIELDAETETRSVLVNENFYDMVYIDDQTGFACSTSSRVLARTLDNGDNWSQIPLGISLDRDWYGMSKYPPSGVAVVGGWTSPITGEEGYIRIGPDAGWNGDDFNTVLRDVSFPAVDTGYICGNDGFIAKTTEGVITSASSVELPAPDFYPNPARDFLRIELPDQPLELVGMDGRVRPVQLKGQRIRLQDLPAGQYVIRQPEGEWQLSFTKLD